jgi:hypothetical protein
VAARTLYPLLGLATPVALCEAMPVTGEAPDFAAALARLARIEAALPGALSDLASADFSVWAVASPEARLRRLAGTEPAVIALLRDFRDDAAPPAPPAREAARDLCAPAVAETTTTYFWLRPEDIASLGVATDLQPALDAFAADEPGFTSAARLWRALEAVLAPDLAACVMPAVEALVLDGSRLGLRFRLDPERAANLALDPAMLDAMPVVEAILPTETPTEAELLAGVEARLLAAASARAEAEIEEAAGILAAASEPVRPLVDVPPEGVQVAIPADPAPPTTGVTDATALALERSLTNPDFVDALLAEDFFPATAPELLRGEVRAILRPVAAEQVRQSVAVQREAIAAAVTSDWSLTPELAAAILALPAVATAQEREKSGDLAAQLAEVSGIQYPSERLFRTALATIRSADPSGPDRPQLRDAPLSEGLADRLTALAVKEVSMPDAPRVAEGFAKPDCGCVPEPGERPEVYAFYPFWFAPTLDAPAAGPSEGDTPAAALPARPVPIDYGLIGRVAFYGLEFEFDDPDEESRLRRVVLRHEAQWAAAKRAFVNEAHRHRAKVDLSFDLRRWPDWTDRNVEEAVSAIAAQMAPFDRLPDWSRAQLGRALPTIFDTPQPDGLTLIFHGYESNRVTQDEIDRMIDIITGIHAALPNRDRIEINVAFDFALVEEDLDEGIFDDLYDLLVTQEVILREPARDARGLPVPGGTVETRRETVKLISRILLFLERRTSDTKKGLRFRMEQGLFKGADRAAVLQSILPVLPPSGHEFVQPAASPRDRTGARQTFGQFEDDVIYFDANFAGLAFWPMPDPAAPETPEIAGIVEAQLDRTQMPAILASLEGGYDEVCTWACPNRAYLVLAGAVLFVVMAALIWRSYYSGRVERFAFRFLALGAVGLMTIALLAILLALTACDTDASVAPWVLGAAVAALALVAVGNLIERARNGPMP